MEISPFREPELKGDLVDLRNFSIHPIHYEFSGKIREIFKTLCWIGRFAGKGGNFPFMKLSTAGTLWIWEIFNTPHPLQFFQEDKRDIQDFGLDVAFWWEKWKFPFCEPELRGD